MKKVMVFGTFDGLHPGHESLFAQAREHGDWVIVVVARDRTVQEVKGRLPLRDEADRQVILLGYDQETYVEKVLELQGSGVRNFVIVWAKPFYPHIYKSSIIDKDGRK
jgi:cytidyltransferase-like protein